MDRTALVTGGASGLGAASAERLRQDGLSVRHRWTCATDADLQADVSDPAAVGAAVADATGRLGRIDVLVNSAGIVGPNKPLWEVERRGVGADVRGQRRSAPSTCAGPSCRGWSSAAGVAS